MTGASQSAGAADAAGAGAVGADASPAGAVAAGAVATEPTEQVDGGGAGRPGAPGTPAGRAIGGGDEQGRFGERGVLAMLFLGPALVVLAVLVAWPIIKTIWLSLHDAGGTHWVGLHNYVQMFKLSQTRKAITNNVIWVVVAPTVVTVLGLIFAVLTERIKLATAFKTILFMPMAVSFLAAGVTWRLVYDNSPDRGVLNAGLVAIHDTFSPSSHYPGARPRNATVLGGSQGGDFSTVNTYSAGTPALLPLVGMTTDKLPANAAPAAPSSGSGLTGAVWLDFAKGGGGTPNAIDPNEKGMPGITVQALQNGKVVATTTTTNSGAFRFASLTSGDYTLRLPKSNFASPYQGVNWLGPALVTPSIIIAYLWIWAGFAMVLISAGLAALPRESLEAARVDGATEMQVFRRVTMPLIRPVMVVVLVTLIINVLKIFDLVYVISPSSSAPDSTVLAVQMYQVSFGGGLDFGLGSALGVLLFILVVPAMLFNIRRLRRDAT